MWWAAAIAGGVVALLVAIDKPPMPVPPQRVVTVTAPPVTVTPQTPVEVDHAISKRNEICALTAADHVCGAHETRVVRTNDVAKMERIVRIGNGQPDEAFLPVSPPAVGVARRGVPGRGGDDLIVGDLPVPDTDPVAQGSSCRIDRAKTPGLVRHIGGPHHGRFAAFRP